MQSEETVRPERGERPDPRPAAPTGEPKTVQVSQPGSGYEWTGSGGRETDNK